MTLSHFEIEQLLGAYALNAVEPDEFDAVHQHLSVCSSCAAEVSGHLDVAAALSSVATPESLWNRIEKNLETVVPFAPKRPKLSIGSRVLSLAAAVAALALVVGMIGQASSIRDLESQVAAQGQVIDDLSAEVNRNPLDQAVSIALRNPDARLASLSGSSPSEAMLIVVLPDGTGFVYENTLSNLPEDLTYQLWAVVDGKVISAGVLGNSPEIVPFHIDPEGLEGLVITAEVAGGVPQSVEEPVAAWFDA